jgi:hypothetical protein
MALFGIHVALKLGYRSERIGCVDQFVKAWNPSGHRCRLETSLAHLAGL